MSVDAVSTFLAVGALLLAACVLAVIVVRLLALVSKRAATVYESVAFSLQGQGTRLALGMALIALLGSLYYSEVAGFPPCEYCWYQRIAMYPLSVILGVAVLTAEQRIRRFVLPMAIPGALIAAYHYTIQRLPDLAVGECSLSVPCTAAWVWKFEIVSIPFMALVSFAVIITVLLLDGGAREPEPAPPEPPQPFEPEREEPVL